MVVLDCGEFQSLIAFVFVSVFGIVFGVRVSVHVRVGARHRAHVCLPHRALIKNNSTAQHMTARRNTEQHIAAQGQARQHST